MTTSRSIGEQLPIDFARVEHSRARLSDPAPSHSAARNVDRFASSHSGRILAALKQGDATVDELAEQTGLQSQQVNKRLPELERDGLATPTGKERASRSGNLERVWRAV